MPVSLCEWRVRIGTFVRRKKKDYDYNHLLRKLFNLMKKTENSTTATDSETSESKTAFHTGSSGTSNSSQYDQNSNTEPSCDISTPVKDAVVHFKPSCDVSSPTGNAAVHLQPSSDIDSPEIHTVTESQSHVNNSGCNAEPPHADGSKDTNHESGLTCKEEDAREDSDCPDVNNMLILRSGDVERNPGPNDTPGNLNELELYLLAEEMDPSDFRKLGLALGFTEAELRRFEKDHQASSMHATYQMLYEWRKTVLENEARETLVSKLEHIRMMKLADSLCRGQVGDDIPTLTEEEINQVADDVKRYLSFELCQIQADPLNSELLLQFERIFTNLTLMEEDKGTKHKTPLLYDDLLKTKVNGFYPKRLLVEGEGGVGKTTLCAKIAWDWIHGVGYQDFKLVLVILLRKAKDKTVGEIVKSYLPDDNPVTAKQLDKYILTNQGDVFLVLDGLDELAADFDSIQQLVQITLNRLFKSGTVLITSRQWRSDEIRKDPDLRKVFAFIAVEGFSSENLASYITKFFNPDKASSEDLNRFISGNDVIKENMAPFPIYTAMLCIMWKEFDGERRQAMCKLQTFSQLFDEMINFLVHHYLSKHVRSSADDSFKERRSDVFQHLRLIGSIAFQGLKSRQLVFPEKQFQSCPGSVDIGCKVGVLTKEKPNPSWREKRNNFPSAVPSVQFPHKLFQEYLSGMWLASLYNTNRDGYDRFIAEITFRASEHQYLLYFTSAQQEEVGLDIASRLIDRGSYNVDADFLVDVAYESQNPAVAKAVADRLRGGTLEIRNDMGAHTVSGHVFVVEHREVKNLRIEKSCGRTASEDLAEFMCTSPSLRSVTIRKAAMHDGFYYVLANQAVHSKIKTLDITCEDLIERPSASRDLAQFICKMPYLKNLTLDAWCHDDFYSTSASMASSVKIETLDVRCEDLRERPSASRDLAQFICKMPHLKKLTLRGLDNQVLLHDNFYSTSASMASCAKIETLDIRCEDLIERPSASRDLPQFICKMPHLKNLTLTIKCHDDFYSTSASMASSAKVETLDIRYMNLIKRPSASRDLAQFICKMRHLKNLTLGSHYKVFLHDDFYSTSSMASAAKIETLDIRYTDLIERPSASRDLAQFICKMPHLKNLTLSLACHDDFFSTSASMASSAKVETLDIYWENLTERPSASRDLAQFICKMPHLKNVTLGKYRVFLHDNFYSTSASIASSAKIETLDIECEDLKERPSASRDLAQFICKMPHLKNLTLDSQYHQVLLHDDFYSTSASMASSAKIETLDIECEDLKERPSASGDLAQFICKMPHLKNLTLDSQYHQVLLHDDFYSTSASMASSAKVETLDIYWENLTERPSASRDLAQFICKMPHLTNLTLGSHYHQVFLHDDFYSTSASIPLSAKVGDQSANTCLTLTDLTMNDSTLEGWQDCGTMFDSVQRFTLRVRKEIHCDVVQRIKLPVATEIAVKTHEDARYPAGFYEDPAELTNAITNAFPKLVKVTVSNLHIGNSMMESILQACRTNRYLKQLRFTRCETDEHVDAFIREFNEDQIIKVEIEHGKPRGKYF